MGAERETKKVKVAGSNADITADDAARVLNDDNAAVMKISNEVWVIILSKAKLTQKELIRARTVCKKWRQIVDEHFEFDVIVHEGKTNLDRIYDLRIKDCVITRLLNKKDIFQYPSLIRKLRFWGALNVECFQKIMESVFLVEELSLNQFALAQTGLVGEKRLNAFCNIKKLELVSLTSYSNAIADNSLDIFSHQMPNLKNLKINVCCSIASIHAIACALLGFIPRTSLQNLQFTLVPQYNYNEHPDVVRSRAINTLPETLEQALKRVKLTMLNITTTTMDLPMWTHILTSQHSLQTFKMTLSDSYWLEHLTNGSFGIPFEYVRQTLLQNSNTLTAVDLREIQLSRDVNMVPFDAAVFRWAPNLKRLRLYRNVDDFLRSNQNGPGIINLNRLPMTIEILEISRFPCHSEELQIVCDDMYNLKEIVLLHTGKFDAFGVHGGIVESICSKPSVMSMNIAPLNDQNPTENKKLAKLKSKFGISKCQHIYYNFERFRSQPGSARGAETERKRSGNGAETELKLS